eukprot:6211780-Pleurochrysis_carterae.AAC.2
MDMWWTLRGVDAFVCEELGELFREELARVVAVKCAHYTCRRSAPFVMQGGEPGEETPEEWSGDVDVDEATRVRGLVQVVGMRQPSRVSLGARCA